MTDYYAHYNSEQKIYQSVTEHNHNTAQIAQKKNPLPEIQYMLWLACICHDCGKSTSAWQRYFMDALAGSRKGEKLNHSTIGGQMVREILGNSPASEMIQLAIYSHHGLQDCISPKDSSSLFHNRQKSVAELSFDEAKADFKQGIDIRKIEEIFLLVQKEEKTLVQKIKDTLNHWGGSEFLYGSRDFYLGMYERVLMSLLIDADRRDTEDFMSKGAQKPDLAAMDCDRIWQECVEQVEQRQSEYRDGSGINRYRMEISELCKKAAEKKGRIYQLTVPTGAGKTMSSLRFAVHYAYQYHKDRIIYVAPYHSVLEQNAEDIRRAVGKSDIVLEHHCNILLNKEDERIRYDRLAEDWSAPIIATTAVQFLNTLFAGKTENVRRMHSLCNSVIIFDEVQSLPVRIIHLFNLAVNYLTEFADTQVVLCTATQPPLNKLPFKNRLLPPQFMIPQPERYREAFRRTTLVDCTGKVPGGMSLVQAVSFIREKAEVYGKILFIANTKACARKIFEALSQSYGEKADLVHLSTGMCPEHRRETLEELKGYLEKDSLTRPCICVSTALIEAGVDISFRCVIRSLAGLDSLIQSAGRCNRHGEEKDGMVYLVEMSEEAEQIQRLKDIRIAQEAMRQVLCQYRMDASSLDGRLDSEKAIKMYYDVYFPKRLGEMDYPAEVEGVSVKLVELLSSNLDFVEPGMKGQPLKQAFRTAGDIFETIEDDGKETLVVEYNQEAKNLISSLEDSDCIYDRKKQILRKLQRFTVSVFSYEKEKIQDGIRPVWDENILVLNERYYDRKLGVTEQAAPMAVIMM